MPKKRHQARYSKPQSTPPSSLQSGSASRSSNDPPNPRGVNELLAGLRRASLGPSGPRAAELTASLPSVPPSIRQILQLPETPGPAPRRAAGRVDASGRRLPPGPPPPRSGFIRSRRLRDEGEKAWAESLAGGRDGRRGREAMMGVLPGAYVPRAGSLVDMCLRRMALEWEARWTLDEWYYLDELPSRLRSALIRYVGIWSNDGLARRDLKAILVPPDEDEDHDNEEPGAPDPAASLNHNFYYLDLSGSFGRPALTTKDISDLLFPAALRVGAARTDVQDSWDAAESIPAAPPALLPNLTHLSLALLPETDNGANAAFGSVPGSRPPVSWRHLLTLSAKLPTLTHLSLARWPEPSLTPNAKYSAVVTAQGRTVQYGGTGPYSHSLDDDWAEAVGVLRRLSRSLYGLEHLDLTGCGPWLEALWRPVDGIAVDWAGHWGKVSTLVLRVGGPMPPAGTAARERFESEVRSALRVERHIVAQRAGKGRFIIVERDYLPV